MHPFRAFAILLSMLTLAACGGAAPRATPPVAAPGAVEVHIVAEGVGAFRPGRIEVPVATTVRWYNDTPAPHNVVFSDLPSSSSRLFSTGTTHAAVFDMPGEWSYVCTLHPTMRGVVSVRPAA